MEKYQPGHTYNLKTIFATYFGLLFLMAIVIGLSQLHVQTWKTDWLPLIVPAIDGGSLLLIRDLLIIAGAFTMAAVTALFLMGLKYEKTFINVVVFGGCFAFLSIFLVFTWADITFRGEMDKSFNQQIDWTSPVHTGGEATPGSAH